jgi:YVTN family beta-propeller protein
MAFGCGGMVSPRHAPAADEPQEFAYVANGDASDVTVIETAGRSTVTGTVKVGSHPLGTAITPDGRRAYVANSGSGTVSVIDTSTREVTHLPVGDYPSAVAVSLDGSRAYVTNTGSDTVSVIDNTGNPPSPGPSRSARSPRAWR